MFSAAKVQQLFEIAKYFCKKVQKNVFFEPFLIIFDE
jgi:hypothetical protein